jgi:hypothetical protein
MNAPQPAVLETLAVAIRKGLDTPDKIAFAYRRPTVRSRVLIHRSFSELLGAPADTTGLDYATVLTFQRTRPRVLLSRKQINLELIYRASHSGNTGFKTSRIEPKLLK